MVDEQDPPSLEGEVDEGEEGELHPMDFSILLLSLNASALMHLGQGDGEGAGGHVNLPMARQTIEMIAMLEDKTRGNLTGNEEQLLNQVLFELRMRYAKRASASSP